MRLYLIPVIAGGLLLGACSTQEEAKISFKNDLAPILQAHCVDCHNGPEAEGTIASGVRLDSYAGVMKGTKFGPIVDPGHPAGSVLVQVLEGTVDKSIAMPHGTEQPLPDSKVKRFRNWVAQGAMDN